MTARAVCTVTLNPAIDQTVTVRGIVLGAVHRASAVRHDAGGKGVNVASTLADWTGAGIVATGLLGADNAAPFEALFEAKGIVDRFVRVPGQTRTNIKLVDTAPGGTTTDINLPSFTAGSPDLDRVRAVVRDAAGPGAIVALSGSLPRGLPASTYADLIAEFDAAGALVALDCADDALTRALAANAGALPHCVKPNRHELAAWAGRPLNARTDVLAAARGLNARGIALVVVSLGAQGALFVGRDGAVHAELPPVEAMSAVGAGDAMVAGLLAALSAGAGLEATARLSSAFAAAKLTCIGPNLPDRQTVEGLARAAVVSPAEHWAGRDLPAALPFA